MKIVVDKENTLLEGRELELLVGLACLIDALRKSGIKDEKIKKAIEFAFVTEKEKKEEIKKQREKLKENLGKAIEKLFKKLDEED